MENHYPIETAPTWGIPILTELGVVKCVDIMTKGGRKYWIQCMPDGYPIIDEGGYREVLPRRWCYLPDWVTEDFPRD